MPKEKYDCACIEKMDALLEPSGARLNIVIRIPSGDVRTAVSTCPIGAMFTRSRKKAPTVAANFCPFCGRKYPEPKIKVASKSAKKASKKR